METRKQKLKRILCNFTLLLSRIGIICLFIAIPIILIYMALIRNQPYLFIFASILEIFAVLIIFLAELFSSSSKEKWRNPKTQNIVGGFTHTKKYIQIKNKKYPHYIGLGRVLKWILDQTETILWIPNDIKRAWFWMWNSPTPENCKITFNPKSTRVGSFDDLQNQINALKEYSSMKILGYLLLFIAFVLQLVYGLTNL